MPQDLSPRLALPLLQPAQAQKHVTHNEALERLDLLVQLVLEAVGQKTPPAAAAEGTAWALGTGAAGAWAGQAEGTIAAFQGGGWVFVAPQTGWRAWDRQAAALLAWTGSAWAGIGGGTTAIATFGINATADTTNRLAVSAPATLLSHEGGDHRLIVNKAGPTNTGALLYQSGWSGRAEIGLSGSDALSMKVSANGAAWTEALRLDPATGRASGAAVQAGPRDAAAGRLMAVGAFGLGGGDNLVANLTLALAPGHYAFVENTATGSPGSAAGYCTLEVRQAGTTGNFSFVARRISANPLTAREWAGSRTAATGPISWTERPILVASGSGANGSFERWSTGGLECWRTVSVASGSITAPASFAFPAAFAGTPRFASININQPIGGANVFALAQLANAIEVETSGGQWTLRAPGYTGGDIGSVSFLLKAEGAAA